MAISVVLEEVDPITKCITAQFRVNNTNISELGLLIGVDFRDDLDLECQYDISRDQILSLKNRYEINSIPGKFGGHIRSVMPYDDLPYLIHTGRELSLMLAGSKPMSYFVYYEGDEFRNPIEEAFEPYVASKAIERQEYCLILGKTVQRRAVYIVYTLPGEGWRGNALILLKKSAFKSGWSEGMERMEGALLGYEDWQNDLHIERSKI